MFKRITSIFLIGIFCCCYSFSYSKPEVFPEWMGDVRAVYPLDEYFAQIGEGKTEAMAKNNAVARIANYLESNVDTTTESHLKMEHTEGQSKQTQQVDISTTVSSYVTLFAVEYTDVFYRKSEKKYYVVAYILRETVWNQYVPVIEDSKNVFYGFIDKAEKEQDPFSKIRYYQEALKSSGDFTFKLDYGRVISPKREKAFAADREVITSIPAKITEIKNNITFNVKVLEDYMDSVSGSIKNQLLELGYKTRTGNDVSYILEAKINYNQHIEEELAVLNPVLKLRIYNSYGDLVNMDIVSEEVIAATVSYAKHFAMQDLQKKIETDFKSFMDKIYDKD